MSIGGVLGRDSSSSSVHVFRAVFTASLSVLPALKDGDVDTDIGADSQIRGLRPVRAGRLLVPKDPNPVIRTSSLFQRLADDLEHAVNHAPCGDFVYPVSPMWIKPPDYLRD